MPSSTFLVNDEVIDVNTDDGLAALAKHCNVPPGALSYDGEHVIVSQIKFGTSSPLGKLYCNRDRTDEPAKLYNGSRRDVRLKFQATKAFESHQIVERSERSFLLQKPYEDGNGFRGDMGAEIFVGYWGTIYVGGDIDSCVFAYGPKGVRERIAWMGGTNDVSYYVAQKASIGTRNGSGPGMKTYDFNEAHDDLKQWLDDNKGEGEHVKLTETIKQMIEDGIPETHPEMTDALFANHNYDEIEGLLDTGMVVEEKVYYCWAALRKLHQLLQEEEDTDERERATKD